MFDNLEYLAPSRIVDYTLPGVRTTAEPIVLRLVYAGNGTAFYNEFAKLKMPDEDATQEDRLLYRERVARIFALHAVVGWDHVVDKGQPVPFTPDNCMALFRKLIRLPDSRGEQVGRWDIIDRAIVHAMTPDNFDRAMPDASDAGKG